MQKGNKIHDELFEGEGVDVAVEDAVEMAGTECFVQYIGQGLDLIGSDCEDQLAEVMEMLSTSTPPSSCNVVVTRGTSFLFNVNKDRSCMIVDSHRHSNDCLLPFKVYKDVSQEGQNYIPRDMAM